MLDIYWTDEAKKWVRDIYNYIALDNRNAAKRVKDGIPMVFLF